MVGYTVLLVLLPVALHHSFVASQQCASSTNMDTCSQGFHRAPPCKQQLHPWQYEVPWQLCAIPHNSCARKPKSVQHRPRHWCKLRKQWPACGFSLSSNRILWESFAMCMETPWWQVTALPEQGIPLAHWASHSAKGDCSQSFSILGAKCSLQSWGDSPECAKPWTCRGV